MFSAIEAGGGSTAVVSGSHRAVARLLAAHPRGGLHYMRLFVEAHLVAWRAALLSGRAGRPRPAGPRQAIEDTAAGGVAPGDVLLMHPLLVHSSSENYTGAVRLAFNVPVRWREALDFGPPARGRAADYSVTEEVMLAAALEAAAMHPLRRWNPLRATLLPWFVLVVLVALGGVVLAVMGLGAGLQRVL